MGPTKNKFACVNPASPPLSKVAPNVRTDRFTLLYHLLRKTRVVVAQLCFLFWAQASAQVYHVEGTLTYQVHSLANNGTHSQIKPLFRHFQVNVKDCAWQVKVVLDGNPDFEYFLYGYDTTNLYYYTKYSDSEAQSERIDGKLPPTNRLESVSVESCPVPRTVTSAGGEFVWLALASGCYLRDKSNRVVDFQGRPSLSPIPGRREIPCALKVSQLPPYLPIESQFFFEKASVFGDAREKVSAKLVLPPRFNTNSLLAEYSAWGFTNLNGLSVPQHFRYVRYMPAPAGSTDGAPILTVEGQAMKVWSDNVPSLSNTIPDTGVVVQDLRTPDAHVRYVITNGPIPAPDSEIVLRARAEARKRPTVDIAGSNAPVASIRRRLLAGLFVFSSLALLVMVVVHFLAKRKSIRSS